MFVDSNSFHIQIQITEKILTTEQEGQKYTNYSKVMIKESFLGTRRYLSRGGGGEEGVGAFWGRRVVVRRSAGGRRRGWEDFGGIVWLSGGTRGSGGGSGGGPIENWLPKREDHY